MTLNLTDVAHMLVDPSIPENYPWGCKSIVTLKDGRQASCTTEFESGSIVSELALERINSGKKEDAEEIKRHFQKLCSPYVEDTDDMDLSCFVEKPEVVLTRLFKNKSL